MNILTLFNLIQLYSEFLLTIDSFTESKDNIILWKIKFLLYFLLYQVSSVGQVIQTEDGSAEGAAQIVRLHQSQLAGSQQVFVALGDSGETADDSGIVAVNVEDLLAGRVTLICEENQ